jgi:di/tricarboxylate transporter
VAALGWLPIVVSALAGALLVTLIGALKADKVYAEIDWRTVVMIAAMLPFATAMNSSGLSIQIAQWLTGPAHWGPLTILGILALATLLLTQALHNAAAAAVMTPIALDAAQQLGANPKTFAVAVLVAASMSVLMPTGHPAPQLVRGKGNYTTGDYLRFGSGLVVLTLMVILVVVPWLWPIAASAGGTSG